MVHYSRIVEASANEKKAERWSYMELRSVSWSGTCQLLWTMMRSRSPAKDWVLFIVWASEGWTQKEREKDSESISIKHKTIIFYHDNTFWILVRSKVQTFSPVLFSVERLREKCKVHCLVPPLLFWLLELFHGPLLICSVLYGGAEEHSPRWLHRHRNLSISFVTLNPLVSFRLRPLNVFDLKKKVPHLSDKSWYFKCDNQTWPLLCYLKCLLIILST